MADVNKINLKALKENYMRKPEEEKKLDESPNEGNKISSNNSKVTNSDGEKYSETKLNEKIKSGKASDKELFSKYESFFKKQEEKIQKKLHKENKVSSGTSKKIIITIVIILVLLVPAYFIYSGGEKDTIESITKDKNIINTSTGNNDKIIIKEISTTSKTDEILKEKIKIDFGGYIFDLEAQTSNSGEKTYHYKGKKYQTKEKLRKGLEDEIEKLKRKKIIKLLLEEKKVEKK